MTLEFQIIPHVKWLWYICEGWAVEPLDCHHGIYSMIAYRKAR